MKTPLFTEYFFIKKYLSLSISLCVFIASAANAQPGSLDNSFGSGGIVLTDILDDDYVEGFAIQPDGKFILGGYSGFWPDFDFTIVRYTPAGTIDSSFAVNGIAKMDFDNGSDDRIHSLLLQPDGKLIAVGRTNPGYCCTQTIIIRYNQNGTIDSSFGSGGTINLTGLDPNSPWNCSLSQPDGKFILAGSCEGLGNADFALIRFTGDGSIDSSFGLNGKVISAIKFKEDVVNALALQPDGKIIAAGKAEKALGSDFALARYKVDGTIDSSFDNDGKLTADITYGDDQVTSLVVQPDGKIIAAGYSGSDPNFDFTMMRLNTDGSVDPSFGNNGIAITDISGMNDQAFSLVLQSDSKLVVAGSTYNGLNDDFVVIRYTDTAIPDSSFGSGGIAITPVGWSSVTTAAALQPDGKIIVAGHAYKYQLDADFTIIRYLIDEADAISSVVNRTSGFSVSPNPFSSFTAIQFSLSQNSSVEISLFDLEGRKIKTVAEGNFDEGDHQLLFLKETLSKGIYLLHLKTENGIVTKKLVIE